jgi:hypothetical protein
VSAANDEREARRLAREAELARIEAEAEARKQEREKKRLEREREREREAAAGEQKTDFLCSVFR